MTFLNPSVLYFLPLLVVPILIHLLNLYKPKKVYYPRVDLLGKIAETTSTRLKLKNWIVLLMRLLFVFFLILAFSQPYFPNKNSTNKEGNVLLYLDTSPSMFVQENGYEPMAIATEVALNILEGLNTSQKVYVLTNEFSSLDKVLLTKKQAKEQLLNLKPNVNSRSIKSILRRIGLLFEGEEISKQFLLSDFQNQNKDDFSNLNPNVVIVPIEQGNYSNVVVDSVWFDSPAMISGKNVKLNVRVKGYNITKEINTGLEFSISNQVFASQQIMWSENEVDKIVSVNFDLGAPGLYEAKIRIDDVPVNFDNEFHFVFEVLNNVDVTILSNQESTPLAKVYSKEPLFDVALYKDGELNPEDISRSKLLIVEGLSLVSNNLDLINKKLEQGSTVLLIPESTDTDYSILSNYFNVFARDSARRELEVNGDHPYFSGVLLNSKENLVKPWYVSSLTTKESLSFVLFDETKQNGVGFKNQLNGKIGLIPFSLDIKKTNLHHHAFFVPLMYEIAFHSSGSQRRLFYRTNNNVVSLPLEKKLDVIELINSEEILLAHRVDKSYQLGNKLESGVYYINTKENIPVLAINHEFFESDVNFMPLSDFEDLDGLEILKVGDKVELTQYFKNLSLGFALWKYCLILSLVFLIAEMTLIRLLR